MKKKLGKLTTKEQAKVELEYHRMKPEDFDQLMTKAKRYSPPTIRVPTAWVSKLEVMAKSEGARGYQSMVQQWIKERLHPGRRRPIPISAKNP